MTTYCLEMRSTADWQDCRYREYTTSARKAELFKSVPKIQFTDSGHGIVPHVREHSGRREPRNMILQDHVVDAIKSLHKTGPRHRAWRILDDCRALLEAIDHTVSLHGHMDRGTPLHDRLQRTLALLHEESRSDG